MTNACPSQKRSEYLGYLCERQDWKKQACDLQQLWRPPVGLSVQATSGLTEEGLDLHVLAKAGGAARRGPQEQGVGFLGADACDGGLHHHRES